uniref:Translation initiation factor IF-2, chloroplastic n=1 Tax=Biomphalaria glabrata TaxID=6526 RepID=A0A2C9LGK5_BIOGL
MELCPPVVTVMGHVDHGKTSLLDAFRQSSITETEFGGITQSTSAYIVQMRDGRSITFIDTPGHEAFADMRIRGAIVTDIVVLVVAADDGVMPQTIEAIGHVKSAGVPMIVAVNKIDKSGANPKKVLTDLIKYGIVVESLGGNDLAVEISAAQKKNIEELENTILLQAEMIKLKANYNRLANGVVLESRFLPGYGACISCIVKGGTLKKGDIVVSGEFYGIVKSLIVSGKQVDKVTPSMPVDIIGLNGVPSAGEKFVAVKNQKIAKEITANYKVNNKSNEEKNFSSDIDKFFATDKKKEINVLIKADVYGSCDAIVNSINNIKDHEVSINVLYSGVGNVNESDVLLAAVSSAHIIGFNVSTDSRVESIAKSKGVEIKSCRIIYEIIDHIKERVSDLFAPIVNKKYIGSASVRKIFGVNKNIIAGCYVTDGLIKKSSSVDV